MYYIQHTNKKQCYHLLSISSYDLKLKNTHAACYMY